MSSAALTVEASDPSASSDRAPLLRWLIFTGLVVFAGFLLWRYRLLQTMLAADRTYISLVILALYVVASAHCLTRTLAIARETETARRAAAVLAGPRAAEVLADGGRSLPEGAVTAHIHHLVTKAQMRGAGQIDQTLLLRALADRLRGSNGFGAFASDTLMKLGLLGTIVGFIIMLAPIAGLDASDKAGMRASMGVMSDGMAVAMYTTLAGLVGSILIKIQYTMLEAATQRLFSDTVTLTETRVTPALERLHA